MNENQEILNQEDILEDTASNEDILSFNSPDTLEDKLDRVEALLNEEITKREAGEDQETLEEEQRSLQPVTSTGSGVSDPDYSQYIYDLLTDSTIKVEIVESQDITEKSLNDYSVSQVLLTLIFIAFLVTIFTSFLDKYIFKFRRR